MHPRERVLGLAALHKRKGQAVPEHLINEAKKLGVDLPICEQNEPINKEPINKEPTKESNDGPK